MLAGEARALLVRSNLERFTATSFNSIFYELSSPRSGGSIQVSTRTGFKTFSGNSFMQHDALQKPQRRIDAAVMALSAACLLFLLFGLSVANSDRALADMNGMRFSCPSGQVRAPGGYTCILARPAAKPNVNIINSRATTLYVGFTEGAQWGKITWVTSTGCTPVGTGLQIAAGATCAAAAVYDSSSRGSARWRLPPGRPSRIAPMHRPIT